MPTVNVQEDLNCIESQYLENGECAERLHQGSAARGRLLLPWIPRPGQNACNDGIPLPPASFIFRLAGFVQIQWVRNMPGAGRHLDDGHHEGPVGGQINPLAVNLEILGVNGIKEPLPERSKMLPDVAVPPAGPFEVHGIIGFLVQSQHRPNRGISPILILPAQPVQDLPSDEGIVCVQRDDNGIRVATEIGDGIPDVEKTAAPDLVLDQRDSIP